MLGIQIPWVKNRKAYLIGTVCVGLFGFLAGLIFLWIYTNPFSLLLPVQGTLFIEDCEGRFLAEVGEGDLGFWPIQSSLVQDDIWAKSRPGENRLRVVSALLSIEDRRFYEHAGVDWKSMGRAFLYNIKHSDRQGGSTIAMQVARMQISRLVETQSETAHTRNYIQKLVEILTAYRLNQKYGREAVLKQYLKLVPMGNRIHGVAYAARRYFMKPVEDLSWAEAALLGSLPKAPGRMNLFHFRGRKLAQDRAQIILKCLLDQGVLDVPEYNSSLGILNGLEIQNKETRPQSLFHSILRIREVEGNLTLNQPLRLSLDLEFQDILQDMCARHIERYRVMGAGNIGAIVADRQTGFIKGYVGSADYEDETFSGSINYSHTPRSSGSTLKPFLYGFGLEEGLFSPASVLSDLPWQMTHQSGHYSVFNYDFDYLGPIIYRNALANSRNIPAVQILSKLGVNEVYSRLEALNLAHESNRGNFYGLGLAIGGLYVTLEDLVAAYGSLACDGNPFVLKWNEILPLQAVGPRVFSSQTTRQISLFLSDPLARLPSFPRMNPLEYPFPVAVKTGTSQGFRDAWCIAYSDRFVVGVWMGHPDNLPMKNLGGVCAAELVKKIMINLHPDETRGMDVVPFPIPRGFVAAKLCPLTGDLAVEECTSVVTEYFAPGQEPKRKTRAHQKVAINKRTGHILAPGQTAEEIEWQTMTVLDPMYSEWGSSRGFPKVFSRPADGPVSVEEGNSATKPMAIRSLAKITEPASGSQYFLDPEVPPEFQTLALKADIKPFVSKVIWYVDGQAYKEVEWPYSVRWPLESGQHHFEVRFTHAEVRSPPVHVKVN